ncbi:hypothetical protein C4K38_3775 [Pseudomonas chlororaphis subsp. piscium]|nr:hypothetical protein C4K38_3775 [Pseudomonas chlororaphis subsp. piscium]SDS84012.1 hypothetical protein SAMN05216585_3613 [Pseudomonas chlororaphis]
MNAEQPVRAGKLGGALWALRDQLRSLGCADRNN